MTTIRIRLTGNLGDVLKAESELSRLFTILERSDFCRNRSRSQFGRLYLTCGVLNEKTEEQKKNEPNRI